MTRYTDAATLLDEFVRTRSGLRRSETNGIHEAWSPDVEFAKLRIFYSERSSRWVVSASASILYPDESRVEAEGDFEDCAWKADRILERLQRQLSQQNALQEFAAGRKGWSFRGDHRGKYAGRTFDFGKHGWVLLSVQADPVERRKPHFVAQINLQFSAGPEESREGELSDINEWVGQADRALSLPSRLGECKSLEHAQQMVGQASTQDLLRLGFYLEFEDDIQVIRRRLVQEFGPKGARS